MNETIIKSIKKAHVIQTILGLTTTGVGFVLPFAWLLSHVGGLSTSIFIAMFSTPIFGLTLIIIAPIRYDVKKILLASIPNILLCIILAVINMWWIVSFIGFFSNGSSLNGAFYMLVTIFPPLAIVAMAVLLVIWYLKFLVDKTNINT